jgi:hypothetical protein
VVVMDFIPLVHVNKRASHVEEGHGEETGGEEERDAAGGERRFEEMVRSVVGSGGRGGRGLGRLRLVNVYDAPTQQRPARNLDWGRVIGPRTILAGDFNAHSPMWNPVMLPSKRTSSAGFLEA